MTKADVMTGTAARTVIDDDTMAWYAMRDIKRPNALNPAYKMLKLKGFEVFTPLKEVIVKRFKKKIIDKVPVIPDLLFVHSTRRLIDPVEYATPTLRYRFVRGGKYREATIVRDEDMNRFMAAVEGDPTAKYYTIGEMKPDMIGQKVHIFGGPLDGFEFPLLKLRGSRKKRVIVEIPSFIVAITEVKDFDYIQIVKEK